jgi:enoyl-CoA hydratase
MADELLRERRGHLEILTINRPEARNAINLETATALSDALDDIEADDDVWVVVLTAAGDKAFSAGMDLKGFAEGKIPVTKNGGFAGICARTFSKPLIAAVNGAALAGGFEIMLSCDLVIAAESARFGIPEVTRGLIAGAGGLIRLPKRIPKAIALEMALTGDPISATRAAELGIVNRVVPAQDVVSEAISLAERIAKNAPLAVRYSKEVLTKAAEMPEQDAWPMNNVLFKASGETHDAYEGAVAFAEKREPNWQGR